MSTKSIQERKKALEAMRQKVCTQIWKIEEQEKQQLAQELTGRFFKYRNSYSCPEKGSDYWYLYTAYVSEGKNVIGLEFQTDKDGKFETRRGAPRYHSTGWVEIDRREYVAAWDAAMKKLEKIERAILA